jgi:hypothetical protein
LAWKYNLEYCVKIEIFCAVFIIFHTHDFLHLFVFDLSIAENNEVSEGITPWELSGTTAEILANYIQRNYDRW